MGREIRVNFFISAICFAVLVLGMTVQPAFGQLSAGDVAFTGFNSDGPGDGFAVVLLNSVSGSQKIHFTSEEWNGSDFTGAGGSITWQAPTGGVTTGTVLIFSDVEDIPSVNVGAITDDTNMNLTGSGDVIYAFLGPDKDTPNSSAFLGAIASDSALYSQPDGTEGTLANTGLTEVGNETILLPDNINNAEYIGDRSGNTPSGYRMLLNDIGTEKATDDNWNIYNGGDVAPFPPFSDESFTVVSPPTIAFATSSVDSTEDSGTAELTVKLVEANGTAVDVDVAFLSGSSTADASDINNYSTTNVSFGSEASNGSTQTVTVNLNDDSNFESTEKAVFELQDISIGTVINPSTSALNIIDDDAPDVVINEFLADPPTDVSGDVNGDGNRSASDDEFVEIVNNEPTEIDISGWQLSDDGGSNITHTFPDGTVLGAGKAIVVFGGGTPASGFGNAMIQTSSETGLSFTNSGGNATLLDASGNVLQDIAYGGTDEPDAGDGQSVTRDPDTSGSFVIHSNAAGSGGAMFSPGTKIDGTAFGSATYAISIRGSEGWRMISTPTSGTAVSDLFDGLWMQGITGSDDPSGNGTIFSWNETAGGSFSAPSGMSSTLTPGKGYIVYIFEDDEFSTPGVQGGFPKIVNTDKAENGSPVSVQVTANDNDNNSTIDNNEGWNLLGNPFGIDISVDALITALEAVDPNVSTNILVWNSDTNSYKTLSSGDTIAPFQAFFVRYTVDGVSGTVSLNRSNLAANTSATFYKKRNKTEYKFSISLHGSEYSDPFHVSFSEKGKVGLDPYDAYKLFSLDPDAINLYGVEGANKLLKNELPENLDKKIEIPLDFVAPDRQELRFQWKGLRSLPAGWTVTLIDRELKQEVDLSRISEYKFTADIPLNNDSSTEEEPLYAKTSEGNSDVRFVLAINPGMAAGLSDDKLPNTVKLNPNYPNPFNPRTTLSFELTQESDVTLTIWNMIGQKVTTLVDGVREAGEHTESWNAANLPSGIYIARFEVGTQVFTRKMTLIK